MLPDLSIWGEVNRQHAFALAPGNVSAGLQKRDSGIPCADGISMGLEDQLGRRIPHRGLRRWHGVAPCTPSYPLHPAGSCVPGEG